MKLENIQVKPILGKRMKELGWTQLQLKEKTGVNQATISRFDQQTRFDVRHLFVFAHALNCKIEDLFEVTKKA